MNSNSVAIASVCAVFCEDNGDTTQHLQNGHNTYQYRISLVMILCSPQIALFARNKSSRHPSHCMHLHNSAICHVSLVTIDVLQCSAFHFQPPGWSQACRPDHIKFDIQVIMILKQGGLDALIDVTDLKGRKSGHKHLTALYYKRVTLNSIVHEPSKSFTDLYQVIYIYRLEVEASSDILPSGHTSDIHQYSN